MCDKKVFLTGGGTAGHVMLHLALLKDMKERGWKLSYVGSSGIEKKLIEPTGLKYYTISVGKLRRYFSWQNLFDVFRLILGVIQSIFLLLFKRPDLVFSKGGFVSVPVSFAAWVLRIPVVSHESDVTPGLANKVIQKFSCKMLYTFESTGKYLSKDKSEYVGTVVRSELFIGSKEKGFSYCGFDVSDNRPIILIMGGSQGAQQINEVVSGALDKLLKGFRVIHLTGRGKLTNRVNDSSYVAFEYVADELKDIFAITDLIVSRAGANSIFESLALHIPMLLIPLEVGSRGDQVVNAEVFVQNNWAMSVSEKNLTSSILVDEIVHLSEKKDFIRKAQESYSSAESKDKILSILDSVLHAKG